MNSKYLLSLLACALFACASEDAPTLGIHYSYAGPTNSVSMCAVPAGGSSSRLDRKATLPALWVGDEITETGVRVEIYSVSAYVEGTLVPKEKTTLAVRDYTPETLKREDVLEVNFEGNKYAVAVRGVANTAECKE